MKRVFLLIMVVAFALCTISTGLADGPGNIAVTKHNLSSSGGQAIRATNVNRICVFCHTPHSALLNTPLWNHTLSTRTSYIVYSSNTLLSTPQNPPDGDSRLCLSCHDGDQPLGSLVNVGGSSTTISMTGGIGTGPLTGPTVFGPDLSGHHPVSIEISNCLVQNKALECSNPPGPVTYKIQTPAPEFLKPTSNRYNPPGGIYTCATVDHPGTGVQCSSCHDAHTNNANFLRLAGAWNPPGYSDALCTTCHTLCP